MVKDETMGKPSVENCVKEACRQMCDMKNGNSAETAWSALREEIKNRVG